MLPESIPTVTVTARYLTPDGRPMTGTVEFRPPALLTHADTDVILGGPTVVALDDEGRIDTVLPATDGEGWNPSEWAYTVTEQLSGLSRKRTYRIVLPTARPRVDLADIAPVDPATPDYVAVPGPQGPPGEPGPQGPPGEPGAVRSVNGHTDADIVLDAADVAAVPAASVGAPGGVASLDAQGLVPAEHLPAGTGGAVASVNGLTGEVVLTAADVGALDPATADGRYLTADEVPVSSVNGRTGAVELSAGDVSAVPAGEAVLLAGGQTVTGAKTFTVPPSTSADPATGDQLARRSYVDAVSAAGTWAPAALGFAGWSFDPATTSATTPQYCINGWLYLIGVPLHAPHTVSNVVFYTPGYVGGTLSSNSYAGLYTSAGQRVGVTESLSGAIPANRGRTIVIPLDAPYSAQPGSYWIALLVNGPSDKGDGPGFARGAGIGNAPAGSARMPGAFVRHGRLSSTGQTSLPASFNPSTVVADSNAIWAALS
ncbi:phage tail protein [Streptomyces sp. TRM43335]|uniref:Phage tail protein n=1 Tax=Streptomyces taklimakanensis TaxID=2569853 RepID=A0A6G2BB42_9ACTN|nr:phage tail protein [Streptomyces taklimakanensis]MTE19495.1 phage tail protein [Streptomyces taklimakanensis]